MSQNLRRTESNDHSMAEVNQQGLVKVLDIAGNVAAMVRYQGKVAVHTRSGPPRSTCRKS